MLAPDSYSKDSKKRGSVASVSSLNFGSKEAKLEDKNFWDLGGYRKAVRRIEDGAKLLEDLQAMMTERASIEKKYASLLTSWSKKWEGKIERGPEIYSTTTRNAWFGLLEEANVVSAEHSKVEAKIYGELSSKTQYWKKDNYIKSMMGGKHKITKKAEDGFEKAQKPWAKLYGKVERGQGRFHDSCKNVDILQAKIAEAELSTKHSEDDVTKLQDKLAKAETERDTVKTKYESRLEALQGDLQRYRSEMRDQFDFCQDVEQKRIDFFKILMADYLRVIQVDHKEAYDKLGTCISGINADADLVQYSEVHGVGMPLNVPHFVAWESRASDGYEGSRSSTGDSEWRVAPLPTSTPMATPKKIIQDDTDEDWENECPLPPTVEVANTMQDTEVDSVPKAFKAAVDNIEESYEDVKVRAIYDYVAEDDEELSIKVGEILTQLQSEDEQGWCKGENKEGQVGYYPAYYVEVLRDGVPVDNDYVNMRAEYDTDEQSVDEI
eukprot:m.4441 g.4441  ORF g.4441 m.4441 type:complete len:494 (-) comp2986_c0_seq1:139-1620(-)